MASQKAVGTAPIRWAICHPLHATSHHTSRLGLDFGRCRALFIIATLLLSSGCTRTEKSARQDLGFRGSLLPGATGCYVITEVTGMMSQDSAEVVQLSPILLESTRVTSWLANARRLTFSHDSTDQFVGWWGVDSLTDSLRWIMTSGLATTGMAGILHDSVYSADIGSGSDISPYKNFGGIRAVRRDCTPTPAVNLRR